MSGPGSLRAAGHALLYWQRRQEVNTNNLANVETPGFRAQRVFAEVLEGGLPSLGTVTDDRVGEMSETGAPLDLALGGEGSFVVSTPQGERLVRSGSFALDADGRIVDASGNPLQGTSGPLILPPGPVEIDARGGVTVAGELVGRIRVVRPGDPVGPAEPGEGAGPDPAGGDTAPLRAADGPAFAVIGEGDARTTVEIEDLPEEAFIVRQGYLEGSNVSALDSLIEMTTIQRSYESVQNSIRTLDSVMETIANRLGRIE